MKCNEQQEFVLLLNSGGRLTLLPALSPLHSCPFPWLSRESLNKNPCFRQGPCTRLAASLGLDLTWGTHSFNPSPCSMDRLQLQAQTLVYRRREGKCISWAFRKSHPTQETHKASEVRRETTLLPHSFRFISLLPLSCVFQFNTIKLGTLSHWKNSCPPTKYQERSGFSNVSLSVSKNRKWICFFKGRREEKNLHFPGSSTCCFYNILCE